MKKIATGIFVLILVYTAYWLFEEMNSEPTQDFDAPFKTPIKLSENKEVSEISVEDGIAINHCIKREQKQSIFASQLQRGDIEIPSEITSSYSIPQQMVAFKAVGLSVSQLEYKYREKLSQRDNIFLRRTTGRHPPEFNSPRNKHKVTDHNYFYKEFFSKTESEQARIARELPLVVEDVLPMIRLSTNMEEQQSSFMERNPNAALPPSIYTIENTIRLLEHIEDINQPLQIPLYHGESLVHQASRLGASEVLAYLIGRGAIVSNNEVYLNPLEAAVVGGLNKPATRQAKGLISSQRKEIISILKNYNLPVRVREIRGNSLVFGGAGTGMYFNSFAESTIEQFQQLGIDLNQRIDDDYFESVADPNLVSDIKNYIEESLNYISKESDANRALCSDLKALAQKLVLSKNVYRALHFVESEKSLSQLEILNRLQALEPGLVDLYRSKVKTKERPGNISISANDPEFRLLELILQNKKNEAASFIEQLTLSDEEKNRIFWGVFSQSYSDISFLSVNGIMPIPDQYHEASKLQAEKFEELKEYGIDFTRGDRRRKSIIYYAAYACNVELINHLHSKGYQYQVDKFGADALATAIRYANCSAIKTENASSVNENRRRLFNAIKAFQPEIKAYHRKRMAEQKLFNVERYQFIAQIFPELAIADNVVPSGYYVEPYEAFTGVRRQ